MVHFDGFHYAPGAARRMPASVALQGAEVWLRVGTTERAFAAHEVVISSALGDVPRTFRFPDDGKFECDNDPAIDAWLRDRGIQSGSRMVWMLERRWRTVVASLVIVVAMVCYTIFYGIPASSGWLSRRIPPSVRVEVGDEMEMIVEQLAGGPSRLPKRRRDEIRTRFNAVVDMSEIEGLRLKLKFREGGHLGANALAIPNGTIIVTDELVEMADSPIALVGVLAHEVGHLSHRHGVQRAIQASSLPFVVALVTGDLASGTTMLGTIPIQLVSNGYSRAQEREADIFALELLNDRGLPTEPLAALFEEMLAQQGDVPGWLSTHPATGDRVRFFQQGEPRSLDRDSW